MKLSLVGFLKFATEILQPHHQLFNTEIPTNRLLLKSISMKYKHDIFREFTNDITTYMYPRSPTHIHETEEFILFSLVGMKNKKHLSLVILNNETQEFLGCAGIHEINTKQPELGIWLKKSAHGHGYGLEAIAQMQRWSLKNLDYEYLIYPVDKANYPSRRIPERLGGVVFREYSKTSLSGRVLNLLEYRIARDCVLHNQNLT